MNEWWPAIGEASIAVGSGLGLTWAVVSTLLRRRRFTRAAVAPVGQMRWFVQSLASMGCYASLITALGLASLNGLLPPTLFWYLIGLSAAAFATALAFPSTPAGRPAATAQTQQEPPADPPLLPVRKSA